MAKLSRIEQLFHQVVQDPAAAKSVLRVECQGDDNLMQAVLDLVAVHSENAVMFVDQPVAGLGAVQNPLINSEQRQPEMGDMLLNYQILKPLGEGGMGAVFLARELEPIQRFVAIKMLKNGVGDPQAAHRFAVERQALAVFRHSAIPSILNAGTADCGSAFLVLEFVDGIAIHTYCQQHDVDIRQRLRLFSDLCQTVHYVHNCGFVHRDIKSANVLVDREDGKVRVHLIDFGIARVETESVDILKGDTGPGQILGTPGCMSPEQYLPGPALIDHRSDIYSLGLLLYKLLTNTSPLESLGDDANSKLAALQNPTPPSVAASLPVDKRLASRLDFMTLKCLQVSPDERYRTVTELLADVAAALTTDTPIALPVRKSSQSRWRRLSRFVSTLACAVVLLVLPHSEITVSAPEVVNSSAVDSASASVVRVDSETFERIAEILNSSGVQTASLAGSVEIRAGIASASPGNQQVVTLLPDFVPADAI